MPPFNIDLQNLFANYNPFQQMPFNPLSNPGQFPSTGGLNLNGLSAFVNPYSGSSIGKYIGGMPGSILGGMIGGAASNSPYSWAGGKVGEGIGTYVGNNYLGGAGKWAGDWGRSIGSTLGGALGGGIEGYFRGPSAEGTPSNVPSNVPAVPSTPRYAQGGHLRGRTQGDNIGYMAQYLQEMGEGDDKVLAHINPEEARELQQKYGGNINPYTGLPQYGWFNNIFKSVAPILGSVLGSAFGGPLGGLFGGALGGVGANAGGNRHDMLSGGIGGGLGAAISTYGPGLLGNLGIGKGASGIPGMGEGLKGIFSSGGRGGMEAVAQGISGGRGGGGFMGGLMNQLTSSPLDTILGLTHIAGMLGRKETVPPVPTLGQHLDEYEKMRERRGLNRTLADLPEKPMREYIEEDEEEEVPEGYVRQYFRNNYAQGGDVGHPFDGDTDGQGDELEVTLKPNSFIIHASAVSGLGNGNTRAGFKKLDDFFQRLGSLEEQQEFAEGGGIEAAVSDGEYHVPAHLVKALGGGSYKKGADMLYKLMRNSMRHTHKADHQPKARSIESYMR
ncbi:MAG TPA: hypothetical protein VHA52_09920 [Candidatus Babeliaceae bacterium]|nr:hypothetical protein [Candidatus Babeliaceae bacterium]